MFYTNLWFYVSLLWIALVALMLYKRRPSSGSSAGSPDKDVSSALRIADNLLEKLPADEIKAFASSDDYEIYRKGVEKLK